MKKLSKYKQCEAIYAAMVTTTDKLPKAERDNVIDAFVAQTGCKRATGNVYFSMILGNKPITRPVEDIKPTPQERSGKYAPEDHASYDEDDADVGSIIEEAFR